ncbi:MAG: DUF7544 domain-containing protein [Halobacteriota archaeon]
MALHAVDDLTDAFEATRSFLWPFEFGRWARLALLSLFVAGTGGGGGGGGAPGNTAQYTPDGGTVPVDRWMGGTGADLARFLETNLLAIVAVVLVFVFLGALLAWIASIFEFTFLESIRSDEVRIREYSSRYTGAGTRLFAFRLIFGLLGVLVVGSVALLAVGPALLGFDPSYLVLFALLIPVFILGSVLGSIVYVFTTAFVAPIMVLEDRGVVSGWRRLWGVMRGNWLQFGVFVLVGLFVMIAVGIAVGIAMAVLAIVVAIPFALLFFGAVAVGIPALNVVVFAVLGIPFALLMLAVVAFVQVPVQTYLRYWALLVLGDVDPDLDLVPDQRAAIRE